ncbi:Intracellular septation protein IspA [hydrothermal vent metagenome]|uniref:Intracellular septation protein IspA n=1 Tax=hydrothermal vent metagenome TaxID=652676 RepID=A0A3B0Y1I9_9ZZZZ
MKILYDFFPILLFFIAYKLGDIYIATAVAIAAAAVQTLAFWIRHRRFEKMHLITFGLLLFFGGLTLLLRDPVFIKWKPSVVNWLFAVVFLGSHWVGEKPIVERMMRHAIQAPPPVWLRLSWMWITFFISIGLLNLYVAYTYSEETWVNFKLFGMLGITFAFVIAQGFYLGRYMIEEKPEGES